MFGHTAEMLRAQEPTLSSLAWQDVPLARLRFVLRAMDEVRLPPYLGSTLRGALAHATRKLVCAVQREDCGGCLLSQRCAYSTLFETPVPKGATALRGNSRLPHPIVIEPPLEGPLTFRRKDELAFDVVLLGPALEHVPYLVVAADKMATLGLGQSRTRFVLERVESQGSTLWAAGTKGSLAEVRPSNLRDQMRGAPPNDQIRVRFLTPAAILKQGHLIEELSFRDFARSLLARISALSLFHGQAPLELDFKALLDRAEAVKTTEHDLHRAGIQRWSNRQQAKIELRGLKGEVAYEGEAVKELWPFIEAGEVIHVGKGTVFGLGLFEMATKDASGGAQ